MTYETDNVPPADVKVGDVILSFHDIITGQDNWLTVAGITPCEIQVKTFSTAIGVGHEEYFVEGLTFHGANNEKMSCSLSIEVTRRDRK